MGSREQLGTRALVTGGASGLGRGIGEALASSGFSVALADLDADAAGDAAHELSEGATAAMGLRIDVTDEGSVDAAVTAVVEEFGGLDLLVNNAGVLSVSAIVDLPLHEWRRVMEVNATGTFLCSRAVARALVASGRPGSIISIASIAGKKGDPQLAHYSASKFAVIGFTQALARELAFHDITANAICPGVVDTQMIAQLAHDWHTTMDAMLTGQAIPRPQGPDEIADLIRFLHAARSVTGQAINIDGGTVFN